MPQVIISKIYNKIIDSIPRNYMDNLNPHQKKQLIFFSEMAGVPLESIKSFRNLAALLILNRFRFISEYEVFKKYEGYSVKEASNQLKLDYPSVFISSILEDISNQSNLVVSSSLINFDQSFHYNSTEILSSLYLEILSQKSRRKLGQFWTPKHIAEFMVDLTLENSPNNILDPCVGPGTFYQALNDKFPKFEGKFSAVEIHPVLFEISAVSLYKNQSKAEIINDDFLKINNSRLMNKKNGSLALSPPKHLNSYIQPSVSSGFDRIICNPPYSRHHVITPQLKKEVGTNIELTFGGKFSRISSLFMYFILKSLMLLLKNGRMVFITPTISFESRNSEYLKKILKSQFKMTAIIVFHHSLNLFPGVDTAACIFVIEGRKPIYSDFTKLMVIKQWVSKEVILEIINSNNGEFGEWPHAKIYSKRQLELDTESNWTNPRSFSDLNRSEKLIELSEFFKVMRGIATGKNSYFTLTEEELKHYKIKREYVVPTITKTRYVQKYLFSNEDHKFLKETKKKVWLLNLHRERESIYDQDLQNYIDYGLSLNVHKGSLVKTRKHWYYTEKRANPYILFTYLSRGNPRFILNEAQVIPLNTFLMLYPKKELHLTKEVLTLFWVILNSNDTMDSLKDAGRCYGGDTMKIEPKEMMKALIVNPFKISDDSRRKLLKLANDLKSIKVSQKSDLVSQINTILEKELSS
ncbi:MAG: class I SAM-dependent DNA methyltransferase [Candidatus Hodarchaeota archaeon]